MVGLISTGHFIGYITTYTCTYPRKGSFCLYNDLLGILKSCQNLELRMSVTAVVSPKLETAQRRKKGKFSIFLISWKNIIT